MAWWDDVFSSDSIDTGNFAVAESFGGPQESAVADVYFQTGTIPEWEANNAQVNAAINSASVDYAERLAADLARSDEQAGAALISSSGSDYAARLAADLLKIGASAALTSPPVKSITASPAYKNGAAILTGARPAATVSTTFDWKEALVGVAVLAGIVVVVKAL